MNDPLSATIVIPTLNEEKFLPQLLRSLTSVKTPLEILVVDGSSEDNTVGAVEQFHSSFTGASSLRLIRSPQRNISLQRNAGGDAAKHGILIFSDADIVVPSGEAFAHLLQTFIDKGCVAAAPRLAPIEPGLRYKVFYRIFFAAQKFLMLFNRPYFAGSYIVTTKQTFTTLGGFDPNVLLGEDVDYSLRAAKIGRCTLINIPYSVSARRIIKYGFGWAIEETPNIIRFLLTGRVIPETIFYPFGEFSGGKAHHVTQNRGKGS